MRNPDKCLLNQKMLKITIGECILINISLSLREKESYEEIVF